MKTDNNSFKFQLDFGSLVKFTTFIGFCFGVGSIPLAFLFNLNKPEVDATDWLIGVPFIMVGAPIMGAVNGAVSGLIGYPMYKWLARRVGVNYKGKVYSNEAGEDF